MERSPNSRGHAHLPTSLHPRTRATPRLHQTKMAEIFATTVAWGALKLASSLVTAGFKRIVGAVSGGGDEDTSLIDWSGDVVLTAREKTRWSKPSWRRSSSAAPSSMAKGGHDKVCAIIFSRSSTKDGWWDAALSLSTYVLSSRMSSLWDNTFHKADRFPSLLLLP